MDVTNLSLDDYIRKSETLDKILKFHKERYSRSFAAADSSSKFDRLSLQDNEDDSDEDMLDLGIKKEDEINDAVDLDVTNCSDPVSEVLNKPLRQFITMERMNGIDIDSQQWRLEPHNVILRRKKGMPYLIRKRQIVPCIPTKYLTGSVKDGKVIKMKVMKKGNLIYKFKDNDNDDVVGISTCHNEKTRNSLIVIKKTTDPNLILSKFLGDLAKEIQEPDDGPKIKPDPDAEVPTLAGTFKKALNKMREKMEASEVQENTEDFSDMPPLLKEPRQIRSFGLDFKITKQSGN